MVYSKWLVQSVTRNYYKVWEALQNETELVWQKVIKSVAIITMGDVTRTSGSQ